MRIPAREVERLGVDRVGELFRDPLQPAATAWLETSPHAVSELHRRCPELAPARLVAGVVTQVRVAPDEVVLTLSSAAIADLLYAQQREHAPAEIEIRLDARLTRSGRVLRLVHAGKPFEDQVSRLLVGRLVQAHGCWAQLRKGDIEIKALATREGATGSYLTRVLRMVFLSPGLVQAILAGRQPAHLDVRALTLGDKIDGSWAAQVRRYG
ncbi:MAG: resolvase [Sphingomonas bacterium]|uniref:hypothetical protein n=1 Tax=Sphingomonas bacterium TaxID=1895847 RepID=UPI00260F2506|nr:hypothetical protein [Sphingomonas bacterium]MDB5696550.1 resolvase [Sphingomonas bacterium]